MTWPFENSCDTHVHVFRPGAATVSPKALAPADADLTRYTKTRDLLGISRTVFVQPTAYGTDNTVCAQSIAAVGSDHARGVAVIDDQISPQDLRKLNDAGFCGARLHMLRGGVIPWDAADGVASVAASAGWHVQLQLDGRCLPQREDQIRRWQAPVVIDHIGKFLEPVATDHAAFECLLRLIDGGRLWVKLSAPYEVSVDGAPDYPDISSIARALVAHAPERMLWASNWPHLGADPQPDNLRLLNLLADWAPDVADQKRILCDNPAQVYGF